VKPFIAVLAAAVLGAACSSEPEPPPPPRTAEQQRVVDSTVGASRLPGAQGVRGALAASDSAAARAARLDSISKAP
jgi:hypothetical protein